MKRYKIIFVVGLILIIIIGLFNISHLHQIVIIDDELGYWGIAAKLAGIDWSSSVKRGGFYSYGYSLFLVPLFELIKNPELRYQISICYNIIFLMGTYFCIGLILKKLFPELSKEIIWVIAFISVIYPNNILQATVAWSECLQILVISLIILLLIYVQRDFNFAKILVLYTLIMYAYIIHQRNIGILLVGLVYLLYLIFKRKINFIQTMIIIGTIVVMFSGHFIVKRYLQNELWNNSTTIASNDYSGQGYKIEMLFSLDGIKLFLIGIIGRLFYLSVATYVIFLYGLGCFIKKLWMEFKNNIIGRSFEWSSTSWILVMFISNFIVAVIYMIIPFNISAVIYGRYIETFMPALIGISLAMIVQKLYQKRNIKKLILPLLICIFLIIAWGLIINNYIIKQKLTEVNFIVVSAIYKYCTVNAFDLFHCVLDCILTVVTLLLLLSGANKCKIFNYLVLLFLSVLFLNAAKVPINTRILQFQKNIDNNMEIINSIEFMSSSAKVYYLIPEEEDYQSTKGRAYLQYRLGEKMECISSNEIDKITQDDYIVMSFKNPFYQGMDANYDLVYVYGSYALYKYNGAKQANGYVLNGNLFDTQGQTNQGHIIINSNSKQYKIVSGYWKLEKGEYKLVFNGYANFLNQKSSHLYYVVQDMSGNIYAEKKIFADDLGDDNKSIRLDFQLPQYEDILIQIYAVGSGIQYELCDVNIQKY